MGLFCAGVVNAGTFSLSAPLTDDASSGISASNQYTHAISGGGATTVNGVAFPRLSSGSTPPNFSWDSSGGKHVVIDRPNTWLPANGGVTGPGLLDLLGSFTYAEGGPHPGFVQTFTLSGLNVGSIYDTRLYIRSWDTGRTGRPIDLIAFNGSEADTLNILEDRPGTMLETGNDDQAYYINYRFTAQATSLEISAGVPADAAFDSGSFHFYGLTNQAVPEPASSLGLVLAFGAFAARRRRSA